MDKTLGWDKRASVHFPAGTFKVTQGKVLSLCLCFPISKTLVFPFPLLLMVSSV